MNASPPTEAQPGLDMSQRSAAILVVDDNEAKRVAIVAALQPLGHSIVQASSGEAALHAVMSRAFATILMDVKMPLMDGYETTRLIRMRRESECTPIIFITSHLQEETRVPEAYKSGAVDFIFAPVVPDILRAKVSFFVDLFLQSLELEQSLAEVTMLRDQFRDSEASIRSVLENVAEGIVTVDQQRVIKSFNRAAVNLFGYSEEETIGQPFSSLIAAVDSSDVFSAAWLKRMALPPDDRSSDVLGHRKDGSTFPIDLAVSDVQLGARTIHIGCIRDISVGRAHAEELRHLAVHDVLTGLPNRVLFADRVNQSIASAARSAEPLALLVLDLNGFKEVNDASGHDRGDVLLQQVAERLTGSLRETDTVARLGGDEFGVLPAGVTDVAGAVAVAWKLQEALKPVFLVDGREIEVQASIGIALFPEHGDNLDDLLRRSDLAMYDAKRSGTGYALFVADHEHASVRRFALLADLRRCLERDELILHYQPKIDLASGKTAGVEALIRWNHPSGTLLMPGEFMHEVEQSELMVPITQWVIREALQRLRTWREQGYDLTMAVNLGARCLAEGTGIFETTEQLMHNLAIPPGHLTFELTESTLIDTAVPGLLARLENLAEPLSIDDFGTGHSSLVYLQRLPVIEVKADRSFVSSMCSVSGDAIIVRSIVDLAHNLSLRVVAEGVEDEETLDLLAEYGCDQAQGYYFSRPMPGEDVVQWLETSPFGATTTLGPIDPVSTDGRPTAIAEHEMEYPDAFSVGAERILVVEDDATARTLTRQLLIDKGYDVVAAANGEEALAIYRDHPVDLVLTDIVMPKLNGRNLAAELRRASPDLPVVFMSGYPNETDRDAMANGNAFIQKPFASRDLGRTVRATLDSKPAPTLLG
ncbi:EAL domain-containing protein [Gaiella sp.]|uniref:EAL domain-containing protein n=1 Tax=Gaiella sp. TaxID=2663207 RepID=UPI0039835087